MGSKQCWHARGKQCWLQTNRDLGRAAELLADDIEPIVVEDMVRQYSVGTFLLADGFQLVK